MFDQYRYGIHYVNDCIRKEFVKEPDRENSGKDYETLMALYYAHKANGNMGAKLAWKNLRKAAPHLDKMKKLYTMDELSSIDPPQYALPFHENGEAPFYAIYKHGLNVIYGPPGCGKTWLTIDFLCRACLGNPNEYFVLSAGEGVPGLKSRVDAWKQHYKQDFDNLLIYGEALPLLKPEAIEEFKFWTYGLNIKFVAIDTLARAMLGENENDTSVMGKFIDECDNIMRQMDIGLLLIHHTNRMGYLRGSIALDGGADSMLKVHAEDDVHIVYNSLDNGGKNKHSEEAPALYFRKVAVQLQDGSNSAVMVKSEKVIDDIVDDKLTDNQMKILRAMYGVELIASNLIVENSGVARRTVFYNLSRLTEAGYVEKANIDAYKLTDKGIEKIA